MTTRETCGHGIDYLNIQGCMACDTAATARKVRAAEDWSATRQPYWITFGGASYATQVQAAHTALDECLRFLTTTGVVKISVTVYKDDEVAAIVSLASKDL